MRDHIVFPPGVFFEYYVCLERKKLTVEKAFFCCSVAVVLYVCFLSFNSFHYYAFPLIASRLIRARLVILVQLYIWGLK